MARQAERCWNEVMMDELVVVLAAAAMVHGGETFDGRGRETETSLLAYTWSDIRGQMRFADRRNHRRWTDGHFVDGQTDRARSNTSHSSLLFFAPAP